MSFIFGNRADAQPAPAPRITNLQPERLDTNEEARPLPWLAGIARLGCTWIAPAIDPKADPIRQTYKDGKNSNTTVTVAYVYSAHMLGLICSGPVDTLHAIYVDGVGKWSGPITRGQLDFSDITIPDYGQVRFYWGSDDQETDAYLAERGHPAYRGQCYALFRPLIFGKDRTNAPQVEFIVERRTTIPGWSNPDLGGDVCPVHAAVELAAHPRWGLGIYLSDFDADSAAALSTKLTDEDIGVSPVIDRLVSLRQALAEILGYTDGFLYQQNGRYHFGSAMIAADYTGAPVIDLPEQTDWPQVEAQSLALASSETRVAYTDQARGLKEAVAVWHDNAVHDLHGHNTPTDLQRRWITRQSVANKVAALAGQRAALPAVTGSVMVRTSIGGTLHPGAPIYLRPHQGGELLPCRVLARRHKSAEDPEVEIEFALDVATFLQGVIPPGFTPTEPETFAPDTLYREALYLAPAALLGDGTHLLHLGARRHGLLTGYHLAVSNSPEGDYEQAATQSRFAATGTLTSGIQSVDTEATLEVHPIDRLNVEGVSADKADADTLLLFIGEEIISLEGYAPQAGKAVLLTNMRRGRFGTTPADHLEHTRGFIIPRENLVDLGPFAAPASVWVKSVPFMLNAVGDISESRALNLDIPDAWLLAEDNAALLLESGDNLMLS